MKRRKILSIFTAAVLCLGVAGCGKEETLSEAVKAAGEMGSGVLTLELRRTEGETISSLLLLSAVNMESGSFFAEISQTEGLETESLLTVTAAEGGDIYLSSPSLGAGENGASKSLKAGEYDFSDGSLETVLKSASESFSEKLEEAVKPVKDQAVKQESGFVLELDSARGKEVSAELLESVLGDAGKLSGPLEKICDVADSAVLKENGLSEGLLAWMADPVGERKSDLEELISEVKAMDGEGFCRIQAEMSGEEKGQRVYHYEHTLQCGSQELAMIYDYTESEVVVNPPEEGDLLP